MEDMLNKINITLDVVLKCFSLVFLITVAIGSALVWSYLNAIDLGSEIVGMLASPTVLSTIAVYALGLSAILIALHIMVPIIIKESLSEAFIDEKCQNTLDIKVLTAAISSPLFLLAIFTFFEILDYFIYALLILSSIYLLILRCIWPQIFKSNRKGLLPASLIHLCILVVLFIISFLTVLVAFPIIKAIEVVGPDNIKSYGLFVFLSLTYSICTAYSLVEENKQRFLPLSVFATIVAILILSGPVKIGLIKNMGLGIYQTNLSIENKYLIGLPCEIKHDEKIDEYDVTVFKSVWVAVSLSDKIILAESEDMKITFRIPSKGVVSEW